MTALLLHEHGVEYLRTGEDVVLVKGLHHTNNGQRFLLPQQGYGLAYGVPVGKGPFGKLLAHEDVRGRCQHLLAVASAQVIVKILEESAVQGHGIGGETILSHLHVPRTDTTHTCVALYLRYLGTDLGSRAHRQACQTVRTHHIEFVRHGLRLAHHIFCTCMRGKQDYKAQSHGKAEYLYGGV